MLLACSSPPGGSPPPPSPQELGIVSDTTLDSAYLIVLQVAWDSVFTPWFVASHPLPVALSDSSVKAPLLPSREPLAVGLVQRAVALGLAAGTCSGQDLSSCKAGVPFVHVVLLTFARQSDGTIRGGFVESVIEDRVGPYLDGTAWTVILRATPSGWKVVGARLLIGS